MRRPAAAAAILLLAALLCAGCGVSDPYSQTTPSRQRPQPSSPAAAGEFSGQLLSPSQRPPGTPVEVARGTPAEVAREVASLAENWTGGTALQAFSRLAAISVGEARAEFEQIAASAHDELERAVGYSSSRATVAGVVVKGGGRVRHVIVVVRRRITSPELTNLPPEYEVALATLRRSGRGWAVSSWSPQP
ncbi:MAG TPA: hypothetical protein VGG40_01890 [Solirubrobacterales bacterium]|jgi:hypothetical protein